MDISFALSHSSLKILKASSDSVCSVRTSESALSLFDDIALTFLAISNFSSAYNFQCFIDWENIVFTYLHKYTQVNSDTFWIEIVSLEDAQKNLCSLE